MLNELGAGAFGVVTRARHRRTGETVAIKWIRGGGGGFDAFVREAGCLAACRGHPSIVQIRDAATDAATGDLFLVMEFVGPCLRDWLTRPVSEDVARSFMRQLLSAAAKMHAAPMAMIHRDIKPENILVSVSGKLKICDFGCATPAAPAGTPYPEQWVGTLPYCAPEQLKGGRCYGSAVDMWALGCVMIEMLIGVDLFTADTEEDMLLQIKDLQEGIACIGSKAFNDLLGLSPAEIDLLAGLLSVEPDKRPTAPEALAHRWFTEAAAESPAAAKAEFPGFVPLFSES
jgi:cell division cycle 2-like